ncbi:MAG: Trk K+ transport system NAD-binding subunit [Methanobacteriota archaeon]|jgi:Trk K+ transport system NAD-binding subunit|uniref:NAD-binding protein n=1 Tax=Halorutilus salinus TaxID=2487751 RepID=A0A9Q4C3Z0_9EURY|nr:NAD-binding protein [Halorutilus salinus]MCX2819432.1 NAD-binding protein [Halorutilus salinus]
MDRRRRRNLYYLTVLLATVFGFAYVYRYGMARFENDPRRYVEALQFVVETYTTTGYGSDSPWVSTEMNVLVIVIDVVGTLMIFLALPVFLFPAIRDALSTSVPSSVGRGVSDHVVICTYTPRVETLVSRLEARDVGYVLIESDRERARELYEDGYEVIQGKPDSASTLRGANLTDAKALVADVSDRVDTSIVLTAKEIDEEVKVVSVVEEPNLSPYHELAGADTVISPRRMIGDGLASLVTADVTTEVGGTVKAGDDFRIVELLIPRGSGLTEETLGSSSLREDTGVNVIGAWSDGEFLSPVPPSKSLDAGTVLLVTGGEDEIDELEGLTTSEVRRYERGETVVAGYGEVGRRVVAVLDEADVPYTVIDTEDTDGVDVVGDITDPDVLETAGVGEANSVIFAVPDDTDAEFATLVTRDVNEEASIAARCEREEAVSKIYRAGADYVVSLAEMTGRMMASAVLDNGEEPTRSHVKVVETEAPGLTGGTLGGADVRSETGCTVVAVERDGEVVTNLTPGFRFEEGDELVIAGTDESIRGFVETFDA